MGISTKAFGVVIVWIVIQCCIFKITTKAEEVNFYTNIEAITTPEDLLVLCNKFNKLDSNYVPSDLVDIGGGMKLREEVAWQLVQMKEAMKYAGLSVTVRSAYRSYAV